jgi:long-subunit fatty acid transport protein
MYVGTGIRFTGFFGSYVSFQSAPPSLHTIKEKEDTLKAPSPKIYAANLLINLGYNFSQKLQVGFDIDAIGFSFGPKGSPKFVSEGESEVAFASPTSFNALLIGANDLGSLQSGLYVRYKFAKNLGVRASYHLLFTELTTSETLQTVPENNKRFRNSSNLIGFGLSYHF